jgi:hypothetical protein
MMAAKLFWWSTELNNVQLAFIQTIKKTSSDKNHLNDQAKKFQ